MEGTGKKIKTEGDFRPVKNIGDRKIVNFNGKIVNGLASGECEVDFDDGTKYKALFEDGCPKGPAELFFNDGTKYLGGILNGKPHGLGSFTYPKGKIITGNYVNGEKHGWFQISPSKYSRGARYENNKFVSEEFRFSCGSILKILDSPDEPKRRKAQIYLTEEHKAKENCSCLITQTKERLSVEIINP